MALLVIDIQQAAFDGAFCPPIDRAADLVANACSLIAAARAGGQPVIFVQHCEKGGPFEEGTPQWELHQHLSPRTGDVRVRKYTSSAFENTDLEAQLAALGARDLVFCGLQSDLCVSNTSKSALALGYRVRIASDGHSTWPSNGETARTITDRVNGELQSLGAVVDSTAGIARGLSTPGHSMTDDEVIRINYEYYVSLFPKVCAGCGRQFVTLGEYVRSTARVGSVISYDAEMADWKAPTPLGSVALSNCPCGTTLALTSAGLPVETVHMLLEWLKVETMRRGVTSETLLDYLRSEIRKLALAGSGPKPIDE